MNWANEAVAKIGFAGSERDIRVYRPREEGRKNRPWLGIGGDGKGEAFMVFG